METWLGVHATLPMGFLGRCSFVKMSRTTVHSLEVLILVMICRDHSTSPLLGCKHRMGFLGFLWSYADNLWVLVRGENCTDVRLACGGADVLGHEVSLANACCSGTDKRISRIRSVARTVSLRHRISGLAMELINGHDSFVDLRNRGTPQSLTPASSSHGRRIWFLESRGRLCMWSKEHSVAFCVSSAVLGVCIGFCTDALESRGLPGGVVATSGSLGMELGGVR